MTLLSAVGPLAPACLSLHASLLSVPGSWNFSLSHKRAIRHGPHGLAGPRPPWLDLFSQSFSLGRSRPVATSYVQQHLSRRSVRKSQVFAGNVSSRGLRPCRHPIPSNKCLGRPGARCGAGTGASAVRKPGASARRPRPRHQPRSSAST